MALIRQTPTCIHLLSGSVLLMTSHMVHSAEVVLTTLKELGVLTDKNVVTCLTSSGMQSVTLLFEEIHVTFIRVFYRSQSLKGRNLAIKAFSNSSSNALFNMKSYGNDGNRYTTFKTANDILPYYDVFFSHPAMITFLQITFRGNQHRTNLHVSEFSSDNFTLLLYGGKADIPGSFRFRVPHGRMAFVLNNRPELPVEKIRLTVENINNKTALLINELEAYGDCIGHDYSLDCSLACPEKCASHGCTIEGFCLLCKKGFYGLECDIACTECPNFCDRDSGECIDAGTDDDGNALCYDCECNPNCGQDGSCDKINGHCYHDCKVGYYGLECMKRCSGNCANDGRCDMVNAHCTYGCKHGSYGSQCFKDCSPHCAKQGFCDVTDGRCLQGCKDGYYGDECLTRCNPELTNIADCVAKVDGCGVGLFGENCSLNCSAYCGGDGSCHIETGQCLQSCQIGFYGPNCSHTGILDARDTWTCHCQVGRCTNQEEECPDKCITGWFGEYCQYRDLGHYGNMSSDLLNDNDDTTCYTPLWKNVSVTWGNITPVSWARLVFDKSGECVVALNVTALNFSMTEPTASMTEPTASMTETTSSVTEPTVSMTKPTASMTEPTASMSEPTASMAGPILSMTEPMLFTCLSATAHNFQLYYVSQDKVFFCKDTNVLDVPGHPLTYDLDCDVLILAETFVVTWHGEGAVCTLNIYGGRNLAQVRRPLWKMLGIRSTFKAATSLTDGDLSDHNCTRLERGSNVSVVFDFYNSILLDTVVIYAVPSSVDATLSLRFVGRRRQFLSEKMFPLVKGVRAHTLPVRDVSFLTLQLTVVSGAAILCEVELYGECAVGFYGLHCEGLCSISCNRLRCTYDGRCFTCVLGRAGDYCQDTNTDFKFDVDTSTTNLTNISPFPGRSRGGPGEGSWVSGTATVILTLLVSASCLVLCFCVKRSPDLSKGDLIASEAGAPQQTTEVTNRTHLKPIQD
ncbi:hypothetical protein Btru_010896 [Bulinus truncatus]|nr:hypothetical protein Btru_010896 [Bulinus truncatus]